MEENVKTTIRRLGVRRVREASSSRLLRRFSRENYTDASANSLKYSLSSYNLL